MVWHNFGHALLFFILAAICVVIGFIALVIGLLVAVPVVVSVRPTPTGAWRVCRGA